MVVAVFSILLTNYNNPFFVDRRSRARRGRITLSEDVSFLNRAAIMRALGRDSARAPRWSSTRRAR